MPNTDQAQVSLQALYSQLDQMRQILTTIEANFRVTAAGASIPLPPDQVQSLKNQYIQLLSQMAQSVKNFPSAGSYFP